jgi:hypothetical protein
VTDEAGQARTNRFVRCVNQMNDDGAHGRGYYLLASDQARAESKFSRA